MGKFVPVSFILAQLEGRQNSVPASIMLIPCSPKCVGADIGVSTATSRYHGKNAERIAEEQKILPRLLTC